MDCCLPGSSAHGIFQARVLEWGAIAFSDICACVMLKMKFYQEKIAIGCGLKGHGLHRVLGVNVFPLEFAQTSRFACR